MRRSLRGEKQSRCGEAACIALRRAGWQIQTMNGRRTQLENTCILIAGTLALGMAAQPAFTQPEPAAVAGFDAYVRGVDARMKAQHRSVGRFLAALPAGAEATLHSGEPVVERLTPESGDELPGALLHDWRGTAFIPGATAAEFDRLLRDFPAYPRVFAPQVMRAEVVSGNGDLVHATMRVVQKHAITVVMDTTYDVNFGRLDARHGWSTSRSTRVDEIEHAGTRGERALPAAEAHGFLWRLDTWWSYEERDGGLYVQIESVSLTRGIPAGLAWAVRPFIQSIPRESLEFTLRAASNAVRTQERSAR